MKKMIVYMIIYMILTIVMGVILDSVDCGIDTWQFWAAVLVCVGIDLNAGRFGRQERKNKRKDECVNDITKTTYIQTCPAQIVPLAYQMIVSEEEMQYYPQEEMAKMCMEEITHELAKALVPYVKIETQRDLCNMQQIIRGTVRVVEPDFRF